MGKTDMLALAVTHPMEFRVLLNFWLWHEPRRDITSQREHVTSGWDRDSMRKCWKYLDDTSRSFSAVIKELDGDLARVICLFYLVLRGLDTIEDDMTLADDVKQPLLRDFAKSCVTAGWTFTGSGPDEKDRQLLVEFDNVVAEMLLLPEQYRAVIVDITQKMADGMAIYAHKAALAASPEELFVPDGPAFDLYCHYVAGLVGEGVSRLFSASGKEAPYVADELVLSNSMGLMLQKTNILRDYREDVDDNRYFWPREFWARQGFAHQGDLRTENDPAGRQRAMWVLSEMVLDALRHAEDCLDYLSLLRNQSVFNFCAIPQTMAMATLALCFMNGRVFERNVKIRKAAAVELIMRSTNPRDVAYIFRDYARQIHAKASPADPNFVKICVACAKIEMWAEHHFPSFVKISGGSGQLKQTLDHGDPRAKVIELWQRREEEKKVAKYKAALAARPDPNQGSLPMSMLFAMAGVAALVMGLSAVALYYAAVNGWFGELAA
ncbi:farnesyl-diphosphate farnesyltransferase [Auricularia subglabra TFB-10046 SS5]|uniref:squalene synthase n=1 Tax=Auricularia subglabra (strain TFB-10046 / SS5) TaxID=717982 RepID=J0WYW2_AURST|nr:farnesyl-diphosphate farnesyltransferase [Auricularia subglabra TFB-10046 SS5]